MNNPRWNRGIKAAVLTNHEVVECVKVSINDYFTFNCSAVIDSISGIVPPISSRVIHIQSLRDYQYITRINNQS